MPDLVEAARVEVDKRYEPDPWEEKVASYVAIMTDVRIDDILGERSLNIPLDRWSRAIRCASPGSCGASAGFENFAGYPDSLTL